MAISAAHQNLQKVVNSDHPMATDAPLVSLTKEAPHEESQKQQKKETLPNVRVTRRDNEEQTAKRDRCSACFAPEGFDAEEDLDFWVAKALEFNSQL